MLSLAMFALFAATAPMELDDYEDLNEQVAESKESDVIVYDDECLEEQFSGDVVLGDEVTEYTEADSDCNEG